MYITAGSRTHSSYQVIIMLQNLRIVDYVIGVPGSLHDSTSFSHAWIYHHPQAFLSANKWIWADTAYPSLTWCVVPFKKPSGRELAVDQKFFNYCLSLVSIMVASYLFHLILSCASILSNLGAHLISYLIYVYGLVSS